MLVFQNKHTGKYVRRLYKYEGADIDTYRHVDTVDEATVFAGWWGISSWIDARTSKGFGPLPEVWRLLEVEVITQPKVKVVKVLE